jgi:hypothetical protein
MAHATHYLDYNHYAPLGLDLTDDTLKVDLSGVPGHRLRQNIAKALQVVSPNGTEYAFEISRRGKLTMVDGEPAINTLAIASPFSLVLYGETLGQYRIEDGQIVPHNEAYRPLTASELRRLGSNYRETGAPYPQKKEDAALIARAKKPSPPIFIRIALPKSVPKGCLRWQ